MEHAGIHDEKYQLIPNAFYARLSAGNQITRKDCQV